MKPATKSAFTSDPEELHIVFPRSSLQETTVSRVKIINRSDKAQNLRVSPATTKYFYFDHNHQTNIAPGLSLDVWVLFRPLQVRKYFDVLKVQSPGGGVTVPLVAAPRLPLARLPVRVNFGEVPLGGSVKYLLPLRHDAGTDIVFAVRIITPSPDLIVNPAQGRVKPGQDTEIEFLYTPTQYVTANLQAQLFLPTLTSTPHLITFTGNTSPGMCRDRKMAEYKLQIIKEPRPTWRFFYAASTKSRAVTDKRDKEDEIPDAPLYTSRGTRLLSSCKTATVKPKHELIGPLKRYLSEDDDIAAQKEQQFWLKVRKFREENRKIDYFRPDDKSGESHDSREILDGCISQWEEYLTSLLHPNLTNKFLQGSTVECINKRTVRDVSQEVDTGFTDIQNDLWFIRFLPLQRFVHAARRVIVNSRLVRRLEVIKEAANKIKLENEQQDAENTNGGLKTKTENVQR